MWEIFNGESHPDIKAGKIIIIVDDKSTDRTLEVARNFEKKYSGIKVFDNNGIELSRKEEKKLEEYMKNFNKKNKNLRAINFARSKRTENTDF
jgi:glycosyltransferase involved in cell wall biosynthesis